MTLSIKALSIFEATRLQKTATELSSTPWLLKELDLTIQSGEIVTLMGPSGCGKSTLLSLISGHLNPHFAFSGSVELQGVPIQTQPPHLRGVGILFQDDLLFPHLTVWENIAFALPNQLSGKQRKQHALATLKKVHLEALSESMPHQLSGGQKARISLLRMLSAQPKAILLDEPFSQLDPELRASFRQWVFEQITQAKIPTLMVTHDQEDAPQNSRILHWQNLNTGKI